MSRVQIALNVSDIEAAVAFYSKLFDVQPNKRRSGYANFAIAEPPLKLVLLENPSSAGSLNHLGIEVKSPTEVSEAINRLQKANLESQVEKQVDCCYAVQDKVWVSDPDKAPWEVYTVLEDSQTLLQVKSATCCAKCA